jgi:hypothetical protein
MEGLEHEAEGGVSQRRQRILVETGDVGSVDEDPAVIGAVEAGEDGEQGGFAAAALPLHHHELSRLDGKGEIVEDLHVPSPDEVTF